MSGNSRLRFDNLSCKNRKWKIIHGFYMKRTFCKMAEERNFTTHELAVALYVSLRRNWRKYRLQISRDIWYTSLPNLSCSWPAPVGVIWKYGMINKKSF